IVDTSAIIRGEIGISNITDYLTFKPEGNYPCIKGIDIVVLQWKSDNQLRRKMLDPAQSQV
ncbi:hypothetical protein M1N22_04450, partial [Dehalococcoidia bacterium]|nr:hypothetical protein [Dehalococcoidia bacterium]